MTPKQKRFVEEYRVLRNASEAARRVGYSQARGSILLRRPAVIAALSEHGVEIAYGRNPPGQQRAPRRRWARRLLTEAQQRFVEEYLVDGNATKAAIRAGLRAHDPSAAGSKMLTRPLVAAAIEREREASMERTRITRDRVLLEYARIAFAEIGAVADWDEDGFVMKPKADIAKDDRAAVAEIATRPGKKGPRARLRMHSKLKALDALARHLGLWGKGARGGAGDSEKHLVNGREARAELRERLLRLARAEPAPAAATEPKKD